MKRMSRAIDGDRLKRKAQKVATEAWKMKIKASVETTLNEFVDWIDDAPTIEPQRKKGRWIDYHTTCSECGWQMIDDVTESPNIVGFNFCPNCGAEMLMEVKDENSNMDYSSV